MNSMRDNKTKTVAATLRRQAEKRQQTGRTDMHRSLTEEKTSKLVHELEVHQLELEMQNEELNKVRNELESALAYATDLYDFAPVGYFTLDHSGAISAVNLTGASLLKIERSRLIGRNFAQLITEKFRPDFADLLQKVRIGHSKESCEVAILNKGGQQHFVLLEAVLNHSELDYRIVMIDISGRRQAEDALRDVEDRMYQLAKTAVDAIIMLDESGAVTFCNTAAEHMFGCTAVEIIGRDFHQLFIPERHLGAEAKGFALFKGQGTGPLVGRRTEVTALRTNGTEFSMELSISALKLQGKWNAIGILRDVTERRLLEIESQDDREYAENIVETVREPLVVLNAELKILTANHSFYETFKVTPEETIGNFIYDVGNRQWDIPKLRLLIETILPLNTVINGYEVEHDFLDIGRKTILLNARQIFREKIGSRIILLAMEDITARKQLETEVQDAREYAENIVETVRRPLIVLSDDLKVRTANYSFYTTFKVTPEETIGTSIYELGNRQWDVPRLKELFEGILLKNATIYSFEIEHDFPAIGRKIFSLNARQILQKNTGSHIILLAMEDITARKQLEAAVQDAREYAENIVETVREPLVVMNSDLRILTANHSFYETFKVTSENTIGHFIYDVGNRQWDIPKLRILLEEILPLDTVINGYEVEHDFPDIGRKTILLNARQIFREKIGSRIILLAMEDITSRKLTEERIGEIIRQQQAILNNIPNIAWLKDKEGKFVAVNEPFSKSFGLAPNDLVGKNDFDIYPHELALKYEKQFKEVMSTGQRTYFEESIVTWEGNTQYVEKIKTPIFNDSGSIIGMIGIAHDITNRKEVEVSLRHESTHDMLTGLYNRAFFDEELERLARSRMFPMSIVMADINGLKDVNDTRGHAAGDSLIRMAAHIILGAFRAEDIVARIGGDEFAVLLPGTKSEVAEDAVRRIMNCGEIINGQVNIAFGIASAENKEELSHALQLSDERMYQDKSMKKNGI